MIDLALANLWKRRLRSSLCILGVIVSVALITTVNGLVDQLHDEMHRDVERLEGKVFLQQKGTGYPGPQTLTYFDRMVCKSGE